MASFPIIWIGGSILVGVLGRKSSVGFWGFLLFSLVFTPFVGALGLLVTGRRRVTPPVTAASTTEVIRLTAAVQSLQATALQQQAVLEQLRRQLKEAQAARTYTTEVSDTAVAAPQQ